MGAVRSGGQGPRGGKRGCFVEECVSGKSIQAERGRMQGQDVRAGGGGWGWGGCSHPPGGLTPRDAGSGEGRICLEGGGSSDMDLIIRRELIR